MRLLGDCASLLFPNHTEICYTTTRRDGRVVYCDCLENSWVHSPGGSNPSPSAFREGAFPQAGCFFAYLLLPHQRNRSLKNQGNNGVVGGSKKESDCWWSGRRWTDKQTLRAFEGDVYANVSFGGSGYMLCVMFIFGRTVKYCVTDR